MNIHIRIETIKHKTPRTNRITLILPRLTNYRKFESRNLPRMRRIKLESSRTVSSDTYILKKNGFGRKSRVRVPKWRLADGWIYELQKMGTIINFKSKSKTCKDINDLRLEKRKEKQMRARGRLKRLKWYKLKDWNAYLRRRNRNSEACEREEIGRASCRERV